MKSNKELNLYNRNREKKKELLELDNSNAIKRGLRNAPYSQLNDFIQYSIGDSVQAFIDYDENGTPTLNNGIIKYNYDQKGRAIKGKNNAEIVILNAFSSEMQEKLQDDIADTLYKPISQIKVISKDGQVKATKFNILLKKVELKFVEELYNNTKGDFISPTITIKDTELAKMLNVDRGNLNRDMNKILIALSQYQIRFFKWGKPMYSNRNGEKQEIPNLALVNIIQDAVHYNGVTQITFNDKFAQHISLCSVLQIPKELYAVKDALTFDLILYFYGQVREKKGNTFKIKIKTIYETIKQITRYENVRHGNYQREIYQPFEDAITTIEESEIANIEYENDNFINNRGYYDFEKWLDTNLIVKIKKAPDLKGLRDSRERYKQIAEKKATKK